MNNECKIRLWSCMKKDDYLRLLKEKTYEYNLTNTYLTNSFLSRIQEDQIFVYYTGINAMDKGGLKGYSAVIKEYKNGVVLEGKFTLAKHVRFLLAAFLITMWIGILWFVVGALYMGMIIFPLGGSITMILYAIINKMDKIDDEERIVEFLTNLQIK